MQTLVTFGLDCLYHLMNNTEDVIKHSEEIVIQPFYSTKIKMSFGFTEDMLAIKTLEEHKLDIG